MRIRSLVGTFLKKKELTIRELEKLVGIIVAACPAVAYGWLYYKSLEALKQIVLIENNYKVDVKVKLNSDNLEELTWWYSTIGTAYNKIRSNSFGIEIFSDASKKGWAAVCEGIETRGHWNDEEINTHINYLELKAAFFGLKSFARNETKKHILLRIDNLTALSYINKMGGIQSPILHAITKEIWQWCEAKDLWIFAEYIASKENIADEGSRNNNIDTEWELSEFAYEEIIRKFGSPEIDLFAPRLNNKCRKFCSWQRDPEAFAINALTIRWDKYFWYGFPPFSLIPRILKKIREEKSTGILVVPFWTNQPWYPEFLNLLRSQIIEFEPSSNLLLSPCRNYTHPLASHLTLIAGVLSGRRTEERGLMKEAYR